MEEGLRLAEASASDNSGSQKIVERMFTTIQQSPQARPQRQQVQGWLMPPI